MTKKRRTRKEKVIAKLKRQLGSQKTIYLKSRDKKEPNKIPKAIIQSKVGQKKINLLTVDQRLIKKDLKKTAFLSLIFIGIIFGLFIFFEKGGMG